MDFVIIKRPDDDQDHVLPITIPDGEQLIRTWPGNAEFFTFGEVVEQASLHDDQQAGEFKLTAEYNLAYIDPAPGFEEALRASGGIGGMPV